MFCTKGVLKNFAKFTGKHLCQSLFAFNFIKKETLAQVFSCEFCEISKNSFFYRAPLVAASRTWRAGEKGTLLQVLSREYLQIFLDSYSVQLQQTRHAKMSLKGKNMNAFFNIFSSSFRKQQTSQFQNNNFHY